MTDRGQRAVVPARAEDRGSANGTAPAAPAPQGCALPRRGPVRAVLKRLYYSWLFRTLAYAPLDALESTFGRRDPLLPPRRLQYVGRGDFKRIGTVWRDVLVRRYGLTPGTDVLDIGCGVGRLAVALAGTLRDGTYRGFDIVPDGIDWCRREITPRHPNFEFELADVRNRQYNPSGGVAAERYSFPYEDGRFDLAVAASVFTHMRPAGIERYMSEASRVLRPGGRLVAEFFLLDETAIELLREGRTSFALDHEFSDPTGFRFLGSDAKVPEFNVAIDEASMRSMAARSGLEVDDVAFGRWSCRPGGPEGRLQDLVAFSKAD